MGLLDQALIDLQQGLESAQASGKREDEAKIRHQVRPITIARLASDRHCLLYNRPCSKTNSTPSNQFNQLVLLLVSAVGFLV